MKVRTQAKRDAILATAQALITEKGIEATTLSDVVQRMGGSKSTIYSYFASKDELIAAVMMKSAAAQLSGAFDSLREDQDLATNLRRFGRQYLKEMLTPCVLATLQLVKQYALQQGRAEEYYDVGPGYAWERMAAYMLSAVQRGELAPRALTPTQLALQLKGLLLSEHYDKCTYGHPMPATRALHASVDRAVDTFLMAFTQTN